MYLQQTSSSGNCSYYLVLSSFITARYCLATELFIFGIFIMLYITSPTTWQMIIKLKTWCLCYFIIIRFSARFVPNVAIYPSTVCATFFFFFKRTVNLNLLLLGTNKFPDVEELIKLEVTGLVIEPNGFVSCITKYELLYLPKPLFVAMFL